jgi:clan AA aspartic protease (TIGR02281 family)
LRSKYGLTNLQMIRIALALALTGAPAMAAPAEEHAPQAVPVEPHNGAFTIPVVLNGVLTAKFIVDSGAADVSIPADIAARLKTLGTMTGADFLGSKTYMLADGSKVPSDIYRIASLRIGSMVMHDVTVRIAAEKSDLLLGQSFLSRLRSWSMDNTRRIMIFD